MQMRHEISELILTNAELVLPGEVRRGTVRISQGHIAAVDPGTQSLTITTLIEQAGTPLNASGYTLPFALAVGVLPPEEMAPPHECVSSVKPSRA